MFENISFDTPDGLRRRLAQLPGEGTAILLSKSAAARWALSSCVAEKRAKGAVWLDEIDPNPSQHTVFRALRALAGRNVETLVAIGGGSAIDLAKAVAALLALSPFEDATAVMRTITKKAYIDANNTPPDVIAVPTTAGTGSEVTRWATVWDSEAKKKYSVEAEALTPTSVWMVPELTLSLPPRATLATGLDAVCQGCEAYWAKRSDPLVKALAIRAVELLAPVLPAALRNGGQLPPREALCTGSLLSGLAFSKTRTTACHSISYPLTARYGIEHGFAAALTLAPVARRNAEAVDCKPLFAAFNHAGSLPGWLLETAETIQPLRLSAFGVEETDLPSIAQNAFTAGRMDNNPIGFSEADVVEILREAL